MPTEVKDVLKVNIVFAGIGLLDNPDEINAFSQAVGAEVVTEMPLVPPGIGKRVSLQRDRIALEVVPNHRTTIEREYPAEKDLGRLAEVVDYAVSKTDLQEQVPTAFGYNMELVYNQDTKSPALNYLGARLFAEREFGADGWSLIGGAGKLVFDSKAGRWSVQVEPRFNSEEDPRVFLNLNLHKAERRIPDRAEIEQTFQEVWEQAHIFIKNLDNQGRDD
ncbi:MAG: hypothetical protein M2R45_00397 [Verrucomicrobia subdivision 3 bacterium]|nr:hypothetical protein [Limisphaerales bacterium]MCS1412844.1 hypothetical protein [Limisphaerales bacterium]